MRFYVRVILRYILRRVQRYLRNCIIQRTRPDAWRRGVRAWSTRHRVYVRMRVCEVELRAIHLSRDTENLILRSSARSSSCKRDKLS